MEEENKLNVKKIIIIVVIFVIAFLLIVGSAILTKNIRNNKGKNQESNIDKKENFIEVKNETENKIENKVENEINNSVKNETIINEITNSTNEISKKNNSNIGKLPVQNPDAISLCKQAQTSKEHNIYLTFDDGPSPNITPQILATLKKYNVPATFFVLGSRVELYPNILKQEYNDGHYIASHGYSHKYASIYSSVQAVIDEYNQCEKAIQNALGIPEYHPYLFRFPGGSSGGPYDKLKSQAKATLEGMGIATTNWNCLTGDAEGGKRTKEQLLNRLYETAQGWDSLVILMHDAEDKQTTADALPEIIEHYKSEGYTFKNYYDIFK